MSHDQYPTISNSHEIEKLTLNEEGSKILKELEVIMPCDVNNPLLGPRGAAYVFGPQKGAKPDDLATLDAHMENTIKHYLKAVNKNTYTDEMFKKLANSEGTGASGGLVAAILACFDRTQIISGMEFVNDVCQIETKIRNSDYIITGEGSLDE